MHKNPQAFTETNSSSFPHKYELIEEEGKSDGSNDSFVVVDIDSSIKQKLDIKHRLSTTEDNFTSDEDETGKQQRESLSGLQKKYESLLAISQLPIDDDRVNTEPFEHQGIEADF